jgi:glycosyltransferase involved in cell wall biosynthesis
MPKKKLLIIAASFFPDEPGGSSRLAFGLASDLANKGHEVWYLCQTRNLNKPEYVFQDGLHVLRYHLGFASRFDLFRVLKYFSAVKRLLRHYLPEPLAIVHGHDLLAYVTALNFYQRCGNFFYTVHSPSIEELAIVWRAQGLIGYIKLISGLPLIWFFELFALMASDGIDAKSEFTVRRIGHYYGHGVANNIRVIPGWVDTARFKPAPQSLIPQTRQYLNWPIEKPVLFVLRRLETRMGLDRLLYAIAQLRDEGYDFYMVIAGTGSQLGPLTQLVNRLKLKSQLIFMGRISDDDLFLAYSACDASIVPTSKLECFGIIALEAMSCGKTVLVTPVGALPEVVGRFEPEWIASSNTSQGIADILRKYLDSSLPFHEADCIAEFVGANYHAELGFQRSSEWLGIDDE